MEEVREAYQPVVQSVAVRLIVEKNVKFKILTYLIIKVSAEFDVEGTIVTAEYSTVFSSQSNAEDFLKSLNDVSTLLIQLTKKSKRFQEPHLQPVHCSKKIS